MWPFHLSISTILFIITQGNLHLIVVANLCLIVPPLLSLHSVMGLFLSPCALALWMLKLHDHRDVVGTAGTHRSHVDYSEHCNRRLPLPQALGSEAVCACKHSTNTYEASVRY